VRAGELLDDAGPLVAMLSGGRDSVCLLDVLVALSGPERVHALHVNYGLRPGADEDERHCRELCLQLDVELEVVRVQRGERAREDEREGQVEGNLHAWARELRYRAAEELARRLDGADSEEDAPESPVRAREEAGRESDVSRIGVPRARVRAHGRAHVATGHTSTDQVETILYRLAASPGRRALLGMERRSGRLVRPLLDISREQTAAYCRERGLAWREDPSNEDPSFARSRVRHGLLLALQAVHPAATGNVLRTAEMLRDEGSCLDQLVDAELGGREHVEVEHLRTLPAALQRLLVIRLAERAAGTLVPQAGQRVDELLALATRGGRAELHVGGLVSAVIESGRLHMRRIAPREQHPPSDPQSPSEQHPPREQQSPSEQQPHPSGIRPHDGQ
jgi:tRNA(Ile)-lysidine synthase